LVERTLLRLLLGTKQCVLLNQQLQQQHQQRYANKSKASDEHFLAVLASTDQRSTAPTARPSRRRDVLPPARWRPNEVVSLIESRGPVGRSGANAASGAPRSRRRPLAHLVADELQELAVGDVIVPPGVLPVQPQCEHRKSGIARSRAGTGQACWLWKFPEEDTAVFRVSRHEAHFRLSQQRHRQAKHPPKMATPRLFGNERARNSVSARRHAPDTPRVPRTRPLLDRDPAPPAGTAGRRVTAGFPSP